MHAIERQITQFVSHDFIAVSQFVGAPPTPTRNPWHHRLSGSGVCNSITLFSFCFVLSFDIILPHQCTGLSRNWRKNRGK